MESKKPLRHCDYLLRDDSAYIIAERLTDLAQINEQVNCLNNHIRDLYKIRSIFLYRLNQVRSSASTLPIEVLSAIFRLLVDPELTPGAPTTSSPTCLRQSFKLGSISSHWRQAALGTPELWGKIQSEVLEDTRLAEPVISSLRHCATYAHTLNISLSLPNWHSDRLLETVTKALFSTEIKAKVRNLELYKAPRQWFRFISQLRVVRSLTLNGQWHCSNWNSYPMILPTSLRELYLWDVQTPDPPFLYQCRNLVSCEYRLATPRVSGSYSEPLVLRNLKRLVMPAVHGLQTIASAKHLQMPSLNYLELEEVEGPGFQYIDPDVIVSFCFQVSATLEGLTLNRTGSRWSLGSLCSLFRSLPHLRRFHTVDWAEASLLNVIRALTYDDDSNRDIDCLPQLRYLFLGQDRTDVYEPPRHSYIDPILNLLRSRRASEGPIFHVDITGYLLESADPGLKEEFKSIVNGYRIKITNRKEEIGWL